ncbi:nucleotidyltransferase domain-containing protein [Comamonas composti]|uniref:nucleotidyltransferase domain-containing protein n=1 Tax=Comamonas composti TaxID=408558 RepID=UPI000420F8FA|nr:nucleotidyltransferase domain-containing protein [Comamonas composti]
MYNNSSAAMALPTLAATPLQPEFLPLVHDVRASLVSTLGARLHSLYLYGSVARATAQAGCSDLDLSLVLTGPLEPEEQQVLEQLRLQLQERHPVVSKIDFDLGELAQVLAPAQRDSWGYWLKHECRCLYGEDLAAGFAVFAPSPAIARALNGDYAQTLADYGRRIARAGMPEQRLRLQKEAARKLIRATNVLRTEGESHWPGSLEDYVASLARRHPEMAAQMEFFLCEARTPDVEGRIFLERLAAFTQWLQQCERAGQAAQ